MLMLYKIVLHKPFVFKKNFTVSFSPYPLLGFAFLPFFFFSVFLRVCDIWPQWGHSWQVIISFSWLLSTAPQNLYFPHPSFPLLKTGKIKTPLYGFQDVKPSVKKKLNSAATKGWICVCLCVFVCSVCCFMHSCPKGLLGHRCKSHFCIVSLLFLQLSIFSRSALWSLFFHPILHFAHISSLFSCAL